ncbi:MAG: glucosaminidase domain-containing protein [Candidatus Moranbacteria bacterium]|nr:glucosaminidase domain-containing protein [Candidatus Moranbacteria bacterium]
MNLENFIRFRRTLRQFGGKILIQPKRQVLGHKWLSSFTALSFTFFSAFPALPNQMPIALPEVQNEAQTVDIKEEELSLEDLCQLRRNVQGIQSQINTDQDKEEERLCLEKKSKDELLAEIVGDKKTEASGLEATVKAVTTGFPIEIMAPSIAHYDRNIAALIVGIAKKESNWGKASPSKGGVDCYNYWGYKGAGGRGTAMGYACFATPEEAVQAIGDRLTRLVEKRATSEPSNLVTTWKCGASCAGHSKESVQGWISDVHQYYSKIALR